MITYIGFSLLIISVGGLTLLFVFKGRYYSKGRRISRYTLAHGFSATFGLSIFLIGACFYLRSWPFASFISPLFLLLGTQISLWAIGISLEILGNVPYPDKPSSADDLILSLQDDITREVIEAIEQSRIESLDPFKKDIAYNMAVVLSRRINESIDDMLK